MKPIEAVTGCGENMKKFITAVNSESTGSDLKLSLWFAVHKHCVADQSLTRTLRLKSRVSLRGNLKLAYKTLMGYKKVNALQMTNALLVLHPNVPRLCLMVKRRQIHTSVLQQVIVEKNIL